VLCALAMVQAEASNKTVTSSGRAHLYALILTPPIYKLLIIR